MNAKQLDSVLKDAMETKHKYYPAAGKNEELNQTLSKRENLKKKERVVEGRMKNDVRHVLNQVVNTIAAWEMPGIEDNVRDILVKNISPSQSTNKQFLDTTSLFKSKCHHGCNSTQDDPCDHHLLLLTLQNKLETFRRNGKLEPKEILHAFHTSYHGRPVRSKAFNFAHTYRASVYKRDGMMALYESNKSANHKRKFTQAVDVPMFKVSCYVCDEEIEGSVTVLDPDGLGLSFLKLQLHWDSSLTSPARAQTFSGFRLHSENWPGHIMRKCVIVIFFLFWYVVVAYRSLISLFDVDFRHN